MKKNEKFSALVVDDDPEIRRILSTALKSVGFDCQTASDGEHARKMLVLSRFDLLVTDLRMPIRHGHRLVVEVFERRDPPMVVIVTGLVEPAIASDLIMRGVSDVMIKPLDARLCATKWLAMLRYRKTAGAQSGNRSLAGDVGSSNQESPAGRIAEATNALRDQLKQITASFEDTIETLERKQENLTADFLGSVRLLTQLMRQFDGSETTHAARVERLAEGIFDRINGNREELRNIRLASLLHDLGMFGMPDSVRVTSPEKMTTQQLEAYRRYPEIGATLLSEVPGCTSIVELILAHSEAFDGTGFPRGLVGNQIPVGARVIRLADGVDSFMMYNKGPDMEAALAAHLLAQRERLYDPEFLDAAFEFIMDSLIQPAEVQCTAAQLLIGDILDSDLTSPQGHIIARRGATVNSSMKNYVQRMMGDILVRVRRPD